MEASHDTSVPELWGGVECTVNRVGDRFSDQLELSGHAARPDDLELFASLGIRAMRYPVLWERVAPEGIDRADWRSSDERLTRLRALGIRPIVGLVHHGSGPRYTSLIDPSFPDKLAAYARAVAERFPWVDGYTPINEPLTTARFSALYGHWYPHARDDGAFARALLGECRATVLAMRAIRRVNPSASLVQTDDLGKTFSTRLLAYQAEFENERRWLTFDLLCGLLDRYHVMWDFLRRAGAGERELSWFLDNPCPPDVLGCNYYVTSERFLDERADRYPERARGGNGFHRYADVEAVRVCAEGLAGPRALLEEAWARYRLPTAITEAHMGCTREEQLRWLKEVWDACARLGSEGVPVRAVTAWAMLGAYDWDSLLTKCSGHYEPGAFDVRAPRPRATALARMIRDLAAGREHDHPVLESPGWWRREQRLLYPPSPAAQRDWRAEELLETQTSSPARSPRPLLITGATGTLGRAFARLCGARGLCHVLLAREEMDIAEPESVERALARLKPWAVINTAGFVRVDEAEREVRRCLRENADGPETLAARCAAHGVGLVSFSSDLVFDGAKSSPYIESDRVAPLNVYGYSKAAAELRVLESHLSALVIRTSAFFGPWDRYNFVTAALGELAAGRSFVAACDALVSPTYVPDLVEATLDLLIDGEQGIWHLSNGGAITWADLARRVARLAGLSTHLVEARPTDRKSVV
jgi:dTDP-4-dehydrorhamnose reductase